MRVGAPVRAGTRRPQNQGMDLNDAGTAARLKEMDVPADLARGLARIGVGLHLVERLHHEEVPWVFVEQLLRTPALQDAKDVAALHSFVRGELGEEDVTEWARMGKLDVAWRLHLKNISLSLLRAFALDPDTGLDAFLRMLQTAQPLGIHLDDMVWWHTAGVLTLTPPYVDPARWGAWRPAAVHHLGMRSAALAAAAGMSVEEAIEQWNRGDFDPAAMKMMAALRSGSGF